MRARHGSQRGLSLIEVLVATAILSLAVVVALALYDAARKAFSKGENATEQQESVRIAFDRMTADLRMLGYNVNPDGNPDRPDEQLEGALEHAVILRADFDASDATASGTPETALAGGAFPTVSTGNDEIVAYVLAKPDGTGPDTITFQADVREPARDGRVDTVSIGNVVLHPTSPPYTLYRVTLNNDSSTYGTPAFVVRTPVVENVRDLSFTYYDAGGTFDDDSSTIPETGDAKARRRGLTRVVVSLVGMTREQDLSYNDSADAAASRYRKFELKGDVTPRNMRLSGMRDLNADVTPPSKPATPTLTPGHCKGLIVTWAPNPASEGVTQYRINWGTSSSAVSGRRSVSGPPFFLDGLAEHASYFVSIEAQDAEGNVSVRSDPASATEANLNKPNAPTGFTASTDQTYHVVVTWTPVTTNTASVPAADPDAPRIRDLAGYRIYSTSSELPFPRLSDAHNDVDESTLDVSFRPPFFDAPFVACQNRYFVMTAVDTCGTESDPTPPVRGRVADAGVKPKPPERVSAYFQGAHTARVRWRWISEDVNNREISIERYQVYRSLPIDGASAPSSAAWDAVPLASVDDENEYTDPSVPDLATGQVVYYRVTGSDDCGNISEPSVAAKLECAFSGDVALTAPTDGGVVSGAVYPKVAVRNGTDNYTSLTITYVHATYGPESSFTSTTPGPNWSAASWTPLHAGDYTITATVTNDHGCAQSDVVEVTAAVAQATP